MAGATQFIIDLSLVLQVARRLAAAPHDPALILHLEALMRERGMVELQGPAPGSWCTWRAVPSVQLLRVLGAYGVTCND
jgi:hypothetical protein